MMQFAEYYDGAVLRAARAAFDWTFNNGLLFPFLLLICSTSLALLIAVYKSYRRNHHWEEMLEDIRPAIRSFCVLSGGILCWCALSVYITFILMDAPLQVSKLQHQLADRQTHSARQE